MLCPECLSKTDVVLSAEPNDGATDTRSVALNTRGENVFGWWTDEFHMRERKCCKCKNVFDTIEVSITDLRDAFLELAHEGIIRPLKDYQYDPDAMADGS